LADTGRQLEQGGAQPGAAAWRRGFDRTGVSATWLFAGVVPPRTRLPDRVRPRSTARARSRALRSRPFGWRSHGGIARPWVPGRRRLLAQPRWF